MPPCQPGPVAADAAQGQHSGGVAYPAFGMTRDDPQDDAMADKPLKPEAV